jgi:hypothetical protein
VSRLCPQLAVLALVSLAAGLAPPSARAASGGPDCFGYTWTDGASGCPNGVPAFGAGAQTFMAATAVQGPFNLGFNLQFYDQVVPQVYVSPAGFVTFSPGQPASLGGTQALPSGAQPNNLVAVYWLAVTNATITVEATPTFFHVRWQQLVSTFTTEVHLLIYPDGHLRMVWPTIINVTTSTVGHENANGTCGRTLLRDGVRETGPGGTFPYPGGGQSACIWPPILLDCAAPTVARCGDDIASQLPATDASPANIYTCTSEVLRGNERVFRVDITSPQATTVAISNAALRLLQVSEPPSCAEQACLAAEGQQADYAVLFPGSYWYVVDKLAAGGGDAFSFSVACSDPYRLLACDTTLAGTTAGGTDIRSAHSCAPALTGPEALFRFTQATAGTFGAKLSTSNPDLWVVIYDRATFETGDATCRAAGRGGAGLFDAPAGEYVIVVDGANGAAGAFDITLTCGLRMDCSAAASASCAQIVSGTTAGRADRTAIYGCTTEALTGGDVVYRFVNPVPQSFTARFLTGLPEHRVLILPACDESDCLLTGGGGVTCAQFPPGEYLLVVDAVDGASGSFDLELACAQSVAGIDLQVTAVDASDLAGSCTDFQLDPAAVARVALSNLGNMDAVAPFDVVVFEDRVINGDLDGGDNVLGTLTVTADLPRGQTRLLDVPCSGQMLFRDNVVYVKVDTADLVREDNEVNNLIDTGRSCEYRPPVGVFTPRIEWSWTGTSVVPDSFHVDTTPLVADMNGDTVPDIIFVTGTAPGGFSDGLVRVISGRGGAEIWTATDPAALVHASSNIAVGDLNGDGLPDVVGQSRADRTRLVYIDNSGAPYVTTQPLLDHPAQMNRGGGAPSIADLDCDGSPEVVFGSNAFRADGSYFWQPEAGTDGVNDGALGDDGAISVVVDVNGDGLLDVVAGPTAYTLDTSTGSPVGSILWTNPAVPDGFPAVGNFDVDDAPEIAITAEGSVYLLEGDTGALIWSRQIPRGGGGCNPNNVDGGPPTIADFDGDCASEVGVAGADLYSVLETDGAVRWSAPINDCSSHRTASTVFDFDGDGAAEVAFMDQVLLRIFSGDDGRQITTVPTASHTWQEMVSIADVDADNNAEIIMPANSNSGLNGIFVIGDADDNWVNTRRIWNQHAYHINNVNDDGSIPGTRGAPCEAPSWRAHGTYRDQLGTALYTAPDITISITSTDVILGADCERDLCLVVRVGNGGGINVGAPFLAWLYDGDPRIGAAVPLGQIDIPDLLPGDYRDLTVCVDFPRFGTVTFWALADDDGTGRGVINECREDNNDCSVSVTNSPNPLDPPADVGPALRATGHGSPSAPACTGDFNWLRDAGAPRPANHHFHVLRSEDPQALVQVPGTEPWAMPTYTDSTPQTPLAQLPHVWFLKVIASDQCEQISTN